MKKSEWVAVAGAIATIVTALVTSLVGLGEHAPGVVGGLLFSFMAFTLVVIQERQLTAIRESVYKREEDYVEVLTKTALALQTASATLTNLCGRIQRMEDQVGALESASSTAAAIVTATTSAAAAAREAAQELRETKAERRARGVSAKKERG